MIVTHAKVSGLANPADSDLVGGEDWDAEHVIVGPVLVAVAIVQLGGEGGGSILSQNASGFASAFSKVDAGRYRVEYDPDDYGSGGPVVIATISKSSGSPVALRWTLETDGADYLRLETINSSGDALNVSNATLTVLAASVSS